MTPLAVIGGGFTPSCANSGAHGQPEEDPQKAQETKSDACQHG